MKKKIILLGIMITALLTGCNDWLDVNPRTEMKQDILFSSETGYKSALIGAYIQLASENLYGKNTSMYFPELLVQTWTKGTDATNNPCEFYVPSWSFTNAKVEDLIEKIWKSYYKCIVHLNDILQNIDADEALFTNNNYSLIKGEALGMRAYLHLDVLRLFGPIPGATAGNKPAIPYAEEMTKDPNKLVTLTYDEVVAKIIRDLNAAEQYLSKDPIIDSENRKLNNPDKLWTDWENKPNDEWQMYRQVRFNYYAVKATKARYYHWIGDRVNACKYAKDVIASKRFELTNENTYKNGGDYGKNLVMLSENILGAHNPDHQSIIQSLFKNENALLTQTDRFVQTAYENITGDIRNVPNRYWIQRTYANNTVTNHFLKYSGSDNFEAQNTIPLLRLAEMYLIVIEDSPVGQADDYWSDFILARNLPETLKGTLTTEGAVKERMEKEYRKEFMGEGQMFFFYKKHAYTIYTWPRNFTVPLDTYEIPRPQSQIAFD